MVYHTAKNLYKKSIPLHYLSGLMNKYILSNLLGYEIEPTILNQEKNNDRVYLSNNTVMPFLEFLEKN